MNWYVIYSGLNSYVSTSKPIYGKARIYDGPYSTKEIAEEHLRHWASQIRDDWKYFVIGIGETVEEMKIRINGYNGLN